MNATTDTKPNRPRPLRTRRIAAGLLIALLMALTACQTAGDRSSEPSAPSVFELAIELSAQRAQNIERLRTYRQASVYPRNRVMPGMANVFIDEDGHLCAVANLMWQDGERDLVDGTARDNNLVVLRDVHDGPLYSWILESGLTQAEIDRIQEPYMEWNPNDPNFEQVEDQRLNDHFDVVINDLETNDGWAILQAARAQREAIVAASSN